MSLRKAFVLASSLLLLALPASSRLGAPSRTERLADAITEIDLARAEKLLAASGADSPALAFEGARLSVYRGDCALAAVTLSRPELSETKEGAGLKELADSCARATAAGAIVEDKARGLWLRVQDDADLALAPFLFDVAARARDAVSHAVGVDLPRPLRIDLVRDLFSLSAVSGLPLSAAETTGTLAVARWGRVILLSPRAASQGFPWEDTLAHEITHLMVTRATRDHAPLWLQEGMAKRLEGSWRAPRPFDEPEWADALAFRAQLEGRSVGIDRLGPSIAMLPTPEAASIAFAEVTSFVSYFVREAGEPALRLLFADLKGSGEHGADVALRSVTGYTLSEWNQRWQRALTPARGPAEGGSNHGHGAGRDLSRRVRLSDLLFARGEARAAADEIAPSVGPDQREPAIRWRAARALLDAGEREQGAAALGALTEISSVHGPWFGVRGSVLREQHDEGAAEQAFRIGIAVDPLAEDAACEGKRAPRGEKSAAAPLPADPARKALCVAARARPRD
ncbi:MAG TPA: hypothetical protein VG937_01220 [Polyangiaceae bacterium]|nr:hypothetical protein [Polyangiaceae bacterium]